MAALATAKFGTSTSAFRLLCCMQARPAGGVLPVGTGASQFYHSLTFHRSSLQGHVGVRSASDGLGDGRAGRHQMCDPRPVPAHPD